LVGIAVFELALSKIMLALLFGTAPLFVAFTLFKATHSFFDRWLGAIAGYAFVFLFVSSILALVLYLADWVIVDSLENKGTSFSTVSFLPIALVSCLGIGITLSAARLAQSIGGTVTTASANSLLAGMVGSAVGGVNALGKTKSAQVAKEMSKMAGGRIAGFVSRQFGSGASAAFQGIKRSLRQSEEK
jgi:type IV secretion system protein VirB6